MRVRSRAEGAAARSRSTERQSPRDSAASTWGGGGGGGENRAIGLRPLTTAGGGRQGKETKGGPCWWWWHARVFLLDGAPRTAPYASSPRPCRAARSVSEHGWRCVGCQASVAAQGCRDPVPHVSALRPCHAHLQCKLHVGRGQQRRHVRTAQQHHRLRAPAAAAAPGAPSSAPASAAPRHERKEQQHGGAHLGTPREAARVPV